MEFGDYSYLEKQELFVNKNRNNLKKYLDENSRINYNITQIDSKLRQYYAGTHNNYKNRGLYINNNDWDNVINFFQFKE
jgi:hypothetical protein